MPTKKPTAKSNQISEDSELAEKEALTEEHGSPAEGASERWRARVQEAASSVSDVSKSSRATIAGMTEAATRSTKAAGETAIKAMARASNATADASKAAAEATLAASRRGATAAASAGRRATGATLAIGSTIHSRSLETVAPIATRLSEMAQNLLASSLSSDINGLVQDLVKGSATVYDKAMDAKYAATHLGGGNHRMFDGGHTLGGAWDAVQRAIEISPEKFNGEGILDQISGTFVALVKDGSTEKGLPFFTWDRGAYTEVANYLNGQLGIPKDWFYDLNSYDPAELLGSTIGTMVLAFRWNEAEAEEFGRLGAGLATAGVISGNPLLIVVSVVALARAFHLARESGDYREIADGMAKGTLVSGATISAVAVIGADSAVPGLGLLVGVATGVLAHKATSRVSVSEIGEFVAARAISTARDIKAKAEEYVATQTTKNAHSFKGGVA